MQPLQDSSMEIRTSLSLERLRPWKEDSFGITVKGERPRGPGWCGGSGLSNWT
jgi:hypothetical protein